MRPRQAHALALVAIVLWSTLASFAALSTDRDPLLTVGIGLGIGGMLSLSRWRSWLVPWRTWLVGFLGLFGYHALYFSAFAHAPAIEVNVLNYLWPLLLMALSPLIVGGTLGRRQLLGTMLGLLGTVAVLTGGDLRFSRHDYTGDILAIAAAVVWALYSLLTRVLPPFPTSAVGGFCLASGVAALAMVAGRHPLGVQLAHIPPRDWLLLVAMGIGPLGISFYCWDLALKHGDPTVIAALAYATPLLSTLGLLLLGGHPLGAHAAVGLLIILAGAILGGWSTDRVPPADPPPS